MPASEARAEARPATDAAPDWSDPAALAERCRAALADPVHGPNGRAAVVSVLSGALKAGRADIAARLAASPRDGAIAASDYARLTDAVVRALFDVATQTLHPNPLPSEGERIALVAVGGYGRAEMAPHSDVDLLFLVPWKVSGWTESVIESCLYVLWDLRLKVGHASRTVPDCLRQAKGDMTIRTALLEHRHLAGSEALTDELAEKLRGELFARTASEFVEAKLAEREERLQKHGGQRYVVEPNVKEGKGGLRDLQSLYWIAKYVYDVQGEAALVQRGVFTGDEFAAFERARSFLWAVRCHLHLATGRATDGLAFDLQVEVARRMGYADRGARRAVEIFMQDYFRHATRVGELTRILLTALEADQTKPEPALLRLFRRRPRARAPYAVRQGRLDIADEAAFLAEPLNMLRVFEEALRTGLLLHPDAMRLISANLPLYAGQRTDPEANKLFLGLLLKHGNPERALRRMNELGALAAFIPEFEPVVAMMQFNMYHHYTVDEHTIQVIATLARIERGELEEELPVATGILARGVNRRVLYVALLCHDIAKGSGEDHSIAGARITRRLAPRLGLKKAEAETAEWLVRRHLLMSDVAQKRDIADPRTVRDFARAVGTTERLDLLTVVTVCDIRGVGPGVWNNWKAQLIRALHRATRAALEDGVETARAERREGLAKRDLRAALEDWDAGDLRTELGRHYDSYWQGLPTATHAVFAEMLRGIGSGDLRIDVDADPSRDATRACFVMADHPGIFARLAGALALAGAEVVDARSYTSRDGFVTAVFWVQDPDGTPYAEDRIPRLRRSIEKTLGGELVAREALAPKDKLRARERPFRVDTHVIFDNEGSEQHTIIEVDTRDRPGLLHDLARTLTAAGINIVAAVVASYGEQAVDTFYVKDMFGLKIHSESRRRILEKRLREAIADGFERADR